MALAAFPAGAAEFSVQAKLDSSRLLMGKTTRLQLLIDQKRGQKVEFPLLKQHAGARQIPLVGDSVELLGKYRVDTASAGADRIRVTYDMQVQAFDSGTYKLPEFIFACGGERAKTESLSLTVLPVKGLTADSQISDFTQVEAPYPVNDNLEKQENAEKSFFEKYWWLLLLLLALVGVLVWAIRRYKKEGSILPKKPEIPPYKQAVEAMRKLKGKKLWENGHEKEFYSQLTYILRRYMKREYGIPAMEMTSRQILQAIHDNDDLKSFRNPVAQILDMADFVKFAKVRPLPDDNKLATSNAEEFLRDAHAIFEKREAERKAAEESKGNGKKMNKRPAGRKGRGGKGRKGGGRK